MTTAPFRRACTVLLLAGSVAASIAMAQTPSPQPAASARPAPTPMASSTTARREDGVRWQSLTPPQREALAPLEREWPSIDAQRKQKWLAIADRFHAMPPAERTRISARMTEWARMTPVERGEVRQRFQESRQVGTPDRSARWEAYQQLPPEQRQAFAARASAAAASAPVRKRDPSTAKTNLVPNPALVQPPRPIAPTLVQATPGATTRPITRPSTTPSHQQSGMPKIVASPEFVNRSTLLPRRGPQAAAVTTPAPITATAPSPAEQPASR